MIETATVDVGIHPRVEKVQTFTYQAAAMAVLYCLHHFSACSRNSYVVLVQASTASLIYITTYHPPRRLQY
jgi:hypothetical protein